MRNLILTNNMVHISSITPVEFTPMSSTDYGTLTLTEALATESNTGFASHK